MVEVKQKDHPSFMVRQRSQGTARFIPLYFLHQKLQSTTTLHNTPSGDSDIVSFEVAGYQFMAISAGPLFQIQPVSIISVACAKERGIDAMWNKIIQMAASH